MEPVREEQKGIGALNEKVIMIGKIFKRWYLDPQTFTTLVSDIFVRKRSFLALTRITSTLYLHIWAGLFGPHVFN